MKLQTIKTLFVSALLLSSAVLFDSCKKDEEVFPAPAITAGSAASGLAGAVVKITATISAPGGLQTLNVLKNGQPFDSKSYTGAPTTDSYTKDYTIESLPANSVVTFTLQATDAKGQNSNVAIQTVTVTAVAAKPIVNVSGVITANTTWTKGNIYLLKGIVRVGTDTLQTTAANVATPTLTIEPGTVIYGERASKGTLVIQRGSKIIANGTVAEPIVFTSSQNPNEREPGDWGGLVICGKAVNNQPGGSVQLEGAYKGWHGGTVDTDNSGSLKYVRVEYAGTPINPNQEVNTFTFGSVGNGTVVENLQASYGLDDSFEWFGGTVNGKYLIAYRGLDDDFDMDFGFRGNLQFIVGIRGAALADQSGSNGFEVDNEGAAPFTNTPFTAPTISNASLIGPKATNSTAVNVQFQNGMHLRRGTKIKVYNTFVTGYPNGIYLDPSGSTLLYAAAGDLVLNRVVVSGVAGWGTNGFGAGTGINPNGTPVRNTDTASPANSLTIGTQTPNDWFVAQSGNKIITDWSTTGINANVFATGRPTFTLATTGANNLSTGGVIPVGNTFFTAAAYIGAFGTTDWTATWAEFNPAARDYSR